MCGLLLFNGLRVVFKVVEFYLYLIEGYSY